MKTLKITNLITEYYDDFNRDIYNYYLDKQLGRIVTIDSMLKRQWQEEGEINKQDLPQKQQENYNAMMAVFFDAGEDRYVGIPHVHAIESANIMRRFAKTVQNKKLLMNCSRRFMDQKDFSCLEMC